MSTVLIGSGKLISLQELGFPLQGDWQVKHAVDGFEVCEMLDKFQPDALILDLSLAYRDGLSILIERFPALPPIVAVLTDYLDHNLKTTLSSLGITNIFELPCNQFDVGCLVTTDNLTRLGLNTPCGMHLYKLGISMKNDGYRYLYAAIPMCQFGTAIRFQKELYPEVMRQCGASSVDCVEHSIRFSIKEAWKHRDRAVWARYFPDSDAPDAKCPTSKVFITTIARMLK